MNGCKFTAAAKLVEIHYRNVHSTGVYKKISNLETSDDIQKYINERKKYGLIKPFQFSLSFAFLLNKNSKKGIFQVKAI